jgi:hypothetical protein
MNPITMPAIKSVLKVEEGPVVVYVFIHWRKGIFLSAVDLSHSLDEEGPQFPSEDDAMSEGVFFRLLKCCGDVWVYNSLRSLSVVGMRSWEATILGNRLAGEGRGTEGVRLMVLSLLFWL